MDEEIETTPDLPVYWQHVPSHFSDGAIGAAHAGGMQRIVMGEICLNTEIGATIPAQRPVFNLVMSNEAIRSFISYLSNLPGVAVDEV